MQFTKEAIKLAKNTIEAIKKISKGKWEWEPKAGQHCILYDKVRLITDVNYVEIRTYPPPGYSPWRDKRDAIPLLHWEDDIEPILEGMGYVFQEPIRRCYGSEGPRCHCVISLDGKRVGWGWGKTRQEAVMRATIKLAKKADGEVKAEN